jgi:hypothetical protein
LSRYVVQADWDSAPHLTKQQKDELWASIPPYQRDARAKGIPQLGAGAIYPILESDIVCEPFKVPALWPRVYGLDVGWNRTAAIWAAWDQEADVVYLYDEWYRSEGEPAVHAQGIKARGDWIPGVIDPAAKGRSQNDGTKLIESYSNIGLILVPADNAVEAGIMTVWERMAEGRLKVFTSLRNWLGEFRIYRRDKNGKVVKKGDHLMDATRYLLMSGLEIATCKPSHYEPDYESFYADQSRSSVTGY